MERLVEKGDKIDVHFSSVAGKKVGGALRKFLDDSSVEGASELLVCGFVNSVFVVVSMKPLLTTHVNEFGEDGCCPLFACLARALLCEIALLHVPPGGSHDSFKETVPSYGLLIEKGLPEIIIFDPSKGERLVVVPSFDPAN